jgi:hypothetical protein
MVKTIRILANSLVCLLLVLGVISILNYVNEILYPLHILYNNTLGVIEKVYASIREIFVWRDIY